MRRSRRNPFDNWERPLLRLAVGCIAVLLLSQIIMAKESARRYLSRVDRFEGEPASLQMPYYAGAPERENAPVINSIEWLREHKIVTLRMVKPQAHAGVYVTVNGKRAGDFRSGQVQVTVFEGDYLEIDAGTLREPGRFVVDTPAKGILSPENGLVLEGYLEPLVIGKVKFKH